MGHPMSGPPGILQTRISVLEIWGTGIDQRVSDYVSIDPVWKIAVCLRSTRPCFERI